MMSMTHALKESGYESDSTLVFKKREDARRLAPDPRKTSQVYRQIQRGGDIPITGLQKPNPPKPKEPLIGPLPFSYLSAAQRSPPARPESPYKYESGEVNIHYRTPVRIEQKESIPEEELARRQEEHMKKVYENERRKKYLAELEDIERRRHTDNFTSPQARRRYLSTLKVVSRLFSSVFSLVRSKHNHPKASSPDLEVHIDNEIRKCDREIMQYMNYDYDAMGAYVSEEVYV